MKKNTLRKLRVAYFAGSMLPGHDGVTRVLYKLANNLYKYNVESLFISPLIPAKDEQPVEMYSVPSITFPLYRDYKFAIPGQKYFEETLNKFRPDLIHINSPCSLGYAAVRYAHKNGIPVVATYHTHFASYAKYYKVKLFENISWNYFKKIYNDCQITYVPSNPILEELKEHGIWNLEYLPHGVDTNLFNPSFYSREWKKNNLLEGKTVILFVGRLVWEKDLDTLVKTYNLLKRKDAVFVLIGDGPIRSELEKLMPSAVFLGYKSGKELAEAYASSDIFVFPSTTETFGNVTLEAMASGLPPICVREGGAYGIIQDNINGLIANPCDPADLLNKIEYLLDYPEIRENLKKNAISFAQTQSWDKIFERLVESYHRVISDYHTKSYKIAKSICSFHFRTHLNSSRIH